MSDSKLTAIKNRFLQIDEEGHWMNDGVRIADSEYSRTLFQNLFISDNGSLKTKYLHEAQELEIFVEAFDSPLVALNVDKVSEKKWNLIFADNYEVEIDLTSPTLHLRLDEWDRFHGFLNSEIPFVFSRTAQASFFNSLDDYDDDAIFVDGQRIELPGLFTEKSEIGHCNFWNNIYENETPRWDLEQPNPALVNVLPQLKLTKQRVLVLGCGSGEDAAHFAKNGHLVTAVDFSQPGITSARKKFGAVDGLNFIQADAFNFLKDGHEQFDLIFEHTFFCAIQPSRRQELVRLWNQALVPGGHLLGIFFAHGKFFGPPFGGSEWEIRQRLKKNGMQSLYWTRWRNSLERRLGKELVVFAQKPN